MPAVKSISRRRSREGEQQRQLTLPFFLRDPKRVLLQLQPPLGPLAALLLPFDIFTELLRRNRYILHQCGCLINGGKEILAEGYFYCSTGFPDAKYRSLDEGDSDTAIVHL